MPYKIVTIDNPLNKNSLKKFFVFNQDSGKFMSSKPLTYQNALSQLRALHLNSK